LVRLIHSGAISPIVTSNRRLNSDMEMDRMVALRN
jgi:hypothetical protein